MELSKEAKESMPKKPQNGYFLFRAKRMRELGDKEGRVEIVSKEWEAISQKDKEKMNETFRKELTEYKKNMDAWKIKYKVQDKPKKSKVKNHDEDTKPEKTKGDKNKDKKDDKKKGDKTKDEKSKSKPKK